MTADEIISLLRLQPHPEGGFYRETYRSPEMIDAGALPGRFGGDRCFSTAISFLLRGAQISSLHRIASDELWHFYLGDPLEVVEISSDGVLTTTVLGPGGATFQAVVPAGSWFGARLVEPRADAFALAGCTVAPGFEFSDFEIARRDDLAAGFPQHEAIIAAMTRR